MCSCQASRQCAVRASLGDPAQHKRWLRRKSRRVLTPRKRSLCAITFSCSFFNQAPESCKSESKRLVFLLTIDLSRINAQKVGVPGNKASLLGNATDANACWALCNATAGECDEHQWLSLVVDLWGDFGENADVPQTAGSLPGRSSGLTRRQYTSNATVACC